MFLLIFVLSQEKRYYYAHFTNDKTADMTQAHAVSGRTAILLLFFSFIHTNVIQHSFAMESNTLKNKYLF